MDKTELPLMLRYSLIAIDRVGFPIMAFCLMFYMCFITLAKLTSAITQNTNVLMVMQANIQEMNKNQTCRYRN